MDLRTRSSHRYFIARIKNWNCFYGQDQVWFFFPNISLIALIFDSAWEDFEEQMRKDIHHNLQTLMDWSTCVHVIKSNSVSSNIPHLFMSWWHAIFRPKIVHRDIMIWRQISMGQVGLQWNQRGKCTVLDGTPVWMLEKFYLIMHRKVAQTK